MAILRWIVLGATLVASLARPSSAQADHWQVSTTRGVVARDARILALTDDDQLIVIGGADSARISVPLATLLEMRRILPEDAGLDTVTTAARGRNAAPALGELHQFVIWDVADKRRVIRALLDSARGATAQRSP